MKPIDTRSTGYPVFFQELPEIGTSVIWWGGDVATLYKISPYTKRNGGQSHLLHWKFEDGRTGTTGIRSKGMYWDQRA